MQGLLEIGSKIYDEYVRWNCFFREKEMVIKILNTVRKWFGKTSELIHWKTHLRSFLSGELR